MTIDEAIERCETLATKGHIIFSRDPDIAEECNEKYKQLAEWLEELKDMRNLDKTNFSDGYNLLNNKMTFVVEVFIEPSINQLLKYNSLVNVDGDLIFSIANFGLIINDVARFDGYEMAGEYNGVLTAYLYFTAKGVRGNPNTFTIDGLDFPVIDYSIGVKNITKTINVPNSNLTKEVYLGKSRAYVFNVLKTNYKLPFKPLYNKLLNSLMGEGSTSSEEFLTLGINFGNIIYTKQVMISEISDDSSNKGIWKITMLEGEYL